MENKLIILVGISGSGKSIFATNYIKENPNILRINRDSIRLTLVGDLDGYYQRKDLNNIEKTINFIEDDIFDSMIYNKYSIIIDNTNLKQSYINRWLEKCENINITNFGKYDFQFKLFDISLEEAKSNVICREGWYTESMGNPDKVHASKVEYIDKQYAQYQEIKKWLETNYKDQII